MADFKSAKQVLLLPQQNSSDANWIAWAKSLDFSKNDNALLIAEAWKTRGSTSANTAALRSYLAEEQGIALRGDNILEQISDWSSGLFDGIGDTLKTGQYVTWGIVIFTVVILGLAVYKVATPQTAALVIGATTPMGKLKG